MAGYYSATRRHRADAPQQDGEALDRKPFIPSYTPEEHEAAQLYWQNRIDPRSKVVVLHGNGSYLKVRGGDLVLFDGQDVRRFPKITHNLTALVLMGQGSGLTFEAVKWCASEGVGIFLLGWYGDLITVVHSGHDANIEMRRAQYGADRLRVARSILEQKIISNIQAGKLSKEAATASRKSIKTARSVDDLLVIEAHAAIEYWRNWCFDLRYKKRGWPETWSSFSNRASPLTKSPRRATHPVNAILNYAYSIVAAQFVRSLTVLHASLFPQPARAAIPLKAESCLQRRKRRRGPKAALAPIDLECLCSPTADIPTPCPLIRMTEA